MLTCGHCGSTFGREHAGLENCPECQRREGLQAPLYFKAFSVDTLADRRHAVDRCRRANQGLAAPRGPRSSALLDA
jgi:hypothetical protein